MTEARVLEGRVVIVTGGGRGVGRAHALACAAAGARVLVNDLGCDVHGEGSDPDVAEAVADEIRRAGGEAFADARDVAGPGGPALLVDRAQTAWGRVDVVIGAAGIIADRTVSKMDDAILDRAIDISVRGGFALVRAASRAMIDQGEGGSIILHTSPVAFFGATRQSALAATGAAVVGLVRCSAIELRKHGIRVNAIAPTARTRTTEALPLFRGIAASSMGPDTVAPVGVFLASDASREVTGEVVGVAGSRIYAIGGRETPGWFASESPVTASRLASAWGEITRA